METTYANIQGKSHHGSGNSEGKGPEVHSLTPHSHWGAQIQEPRRKVITTSVQPCFALSCLNLSALPWTQVNISVQSNFQISLHLLFPHHQMVEMAVRWGTWEGWNFVKSCDLMLCYAGVAGLPAPWSLRGFGELSSSELCCGLQPLDWHA